MDDIAGKISALLNDPDGIEKIKAVASTLLSDGSTKSEPEASDDGGFSLPDGLDIGKIMGLASVFGNQGNDRRSELLLALKPHLSAERRERVDKAVKLLKIAAVLPILKEQGLLDFIL